MEKNNVLQTTGQAKVSSKVKASVIGFFAVSSSLFSATSMAALDGTAAAAEITANQPGLIVIGTAVIATLAVICGFQYAKRLL